MIGCIGAPLSQIMTKRTVEEPFGVVVKWTRCYSDAAGLATSARKLTFPIS